MSFAETMVPSAWEVTVLVVASAHPATRLLDIVLYIALILFS